MNSVAEGIRVRSACKAAVEAFKKLNKPEFSDIISKIEYCIASYDYDQNPEGLFEFAEKAHRLLIEEKKVKSEKDK
jgi:hypothetical protein